MWELSLDVCIFGAGLQPASGDTQMVCWNFEVAIKLQSHSLCGTVNGVPREEEGQQDLLKVAPSLWELSVDECLEVGSGWRPAET